MSHQDTELDSLVDFLLSIEVKSEKAFGEIGKIELKDFMHSIKRMMEYGLQKMKLEDIITGMRIFRKIIERTKPESKKLAADWDEELK